MQVGGRHWAVSMVNLNTNPLECWAGKVLECLELEDQFCDSMKDKNTVERSVDNVNLAPEVSGGRQDSLGAVCIIFSIEEW